MKTFFNVIRSIFSYVLFIILLVLLIISPLLISLSTLLTNRETLPKWIKEAGIYAEIPNLLVNQLKAGIKTEGGNLSSFPIKNFEKTLKKTFTPTFLQSNIETLIFDGYDWLEGKTKNYTFSMENIDLGPLFKVLLPPEMLKNNTTMVKQLDNLKPCTPTQTIKYEQLGGFKSTNDVCVPPTIDIIKVVEEGYKEPSNKLKLISFNNMIKTPPLDQGSADNILLGYKIADNLVLILPSIILLLSILFILLEPSKYFKYYILGIFTTIIGIFNLIIFKSSFILNYINILFEKLLSENSKQIDFALPIIQNLYHEVQGDLFKIAGTVDLFILVGGILVLGISLTLNLIERNKNK